MPPDRLDATFAALSDPTRRAVLARLARGEATVTELARPFDVALPTFSRHLQVLERAGLIRRGRDRNYRPCRIAAAPLREANAWLEQYRAIWDDRLDRMEDVVRQMMDEQLRDGPDDATG